MPRPIDSRREGQIRPLRAQGLGVRRIAREVKASPSIETASASDAIVILYGGPEREHLLFRALCCDEGPVSATCGTHSIEDSVPLVATGKAGSTRAEFVESVKN